MQVSRYGAQDDWKACKGWSTCAQPVYAGYTEQLTRPRIEMPGKGSNRSKGSTFRGMLWRPEAHKGVGGTELTTAHSAGWPSVLGPLSLGHVLGAVSHILGTCLWIPGDTWRLPGDASRCLN